FTTFQLRPPPPLKKRSTQAGMAQAQSHTTRAHACKHPKPAAGERAIIYQTQTKHTA
uniref:Uncharacterized protein n=1 Tax=Aegilops tauschii subsp. strangulata TaxID=200361 RepID=A0A453RAT5_AEGTS